MTDLLRKAFEEASRLREQEQNAVARWLLDELASERQWDAAFAKSRDELAELAEEARAEFREGRTEPLAPDDLRTRTPHSDSGRR